MKLRWLPWLGLPLFLLLVSATPAAATPSPRSSPNTRLARARAALHRIEATAFGIQRTLAFTRRRRRAPAVYCVNGKLSQAHANARLAQRRLRKLKRALESSDQHARTHEHALSLLTQRTVRLGWAAQRCARVTAPTRSEVRILARSGHPSTKH